MNKALLTLVKDLASLLLMWAIAILLIASCSNPSYASHVHPHGELALTGYNNEGAQSARAFFVRNISMRSHVMAKLERDIFICAGYLHYQSVNPFQLCHHYLTVIGKALFLNEGAH